MAEPYRERRLAQGHPDLETKSADVFLASLHARPDGRARLLRLVTLLERLVGLAPGSRLLVLGCGPRPETVQVLLEKGFEVIGVEPVPEFVRLAREHVPPDRVVEGAAEAMPLPDASQDVVFCESVLEHVDSAQRAMAEIHRVLKPGGVAVVTTTNRHRFSLSGDNGEYNVPFYNWLPPLLKECYVFQHLHYYPRLANYSSRPAVHWWCYSELCELGRQAGFAAFHSMIDLLRPEDPAIARSRLRRFLLPHIQRRPWLRALALSQLGGLALMVKR